MRPHRGIEDFRLVVISPPHERQIEVEGIERLVEQQLLAETHSDLDVLSSHTRIEGVSDVEVDAIRVTNEGIEIRGTGTVEVELSNDSEGGVADAFPFTFTLDMGEGRAVRKAHFEFDTSRFHAWSPWRFQYEHALAPDPGERNGSSRPLAHGRAQRVRGQGSRAR